MDAINLFQFFTIAGLLNAVAISLFLVFRKNHHSANIYLSVLLMVVSFQAVLNAFDTRDFFLQNPHLGRISWLTPSLFGPLVYLFTLKISSNNNTFRLTDLIHFIPFGIYISMLGPWFLKTAAEKRLYFGDFEVACKDDFGFLNQLSIFIILFYLIAALVYLRNHRRRIKNIYADISKTRLDWLRNFVYAVLGILMLSAVTFYGRKNQLPVLTDFYHYNYALVVLLIYWIAYKAASQSVIFENKWMEPIHEKTVPQEQTEPIQILPDLDSGTKYSRSGLSEALAGDHYNNLLSYMNMKKPYLDPELSIYQLAEMVQLSKHHLSQIINEKTGKNFFDFINEYRVQEVKLKLADAAQNNLTVLALAYEAGFNSKATFNSVFKKMTGLTPSEYKKRLQNLV
jgi:AraC-like DNA-binding protein